MLKDIKKILIDDFHLLAKWGIKYSPVLLIMIAAYVGIYLFNLLLAWLLAPYEYGNIAVLLQVLVLLSPFILCGTELAMLKYLPKYHADSEHGKIKGFIRWNLRYFLIASLIVLVIGGTISTLAATTSFLGSKEISAYHPLIFSFWLLPLFAYMILQSCLLQAMRHYLIAAISKGAGLYFTALVIVYAAAMIYGHSGVYDVIFILGISCFLIAILQVIALYFFLPHEIKLSDVVYEVSRWRVSSMQMMLSSVILSGLQAVDIIMLNILIGSHNAVGHFAAILVMVSVIPVFGRAANLIINPQVSTGVLEENREGFQHTINLANVLKLIPILILYLVLIIWGRDLLGWFGKSYIQHYHLMISLGGAYVVWSLLMGATPLLLYSGHQKMVVYISGGQLIAAVILNFILIPLFGLWGVGISLIVTMLGSSIISALMVKKYLPVKTFFF
ncbi:MAG: oligosaccharide flippase family protein [Simkaniaceae bacterium]|nr:oligosaccharide flippase family protein [Simkaniaceae bacterium]